MPKISLEQADQITNFNVDCSDETDPRECTTVPDFQSCLTKFVLIAHPNCSVVCEW